MASNIRAQVMGGEVREVKAKTVDDVREKLRLDKTYTATVNGEPEDGEFELDDDDKVVFAKAVKGGC